MDFFTKLDIKIKEWRKCRTKDNSFLVSFIKGKDSPVFAESSKKSNVTRP